MSDLRDGLAGGDVTVGRHVPLVVEYPEAVTLRPGSVDDGSEGCLGVGSGRKRLIDRTVVEGEDFSRRELAESLGLGLRRCLVRAPVVGAVEIRAQEHGVA